MPSISGPKISMPDVDFNLKGSKLKVMLTCQFQKWKEVLKHQKWKLKAQKLKDPRVVFKMPKIKMPSFGMKGPKLEGPDVDVKIPKSRYRH